MKITKVIPSRRWRNARTGRDVSVYGAVPWTSESERSDWSMVTVGWTWLREDGCVGLCRRPAETREEAEEVMAAVNGRASR